MKLTAMFLALAISVALLASCVTNGNDELPKNTAIRQDENMGYGEPPSHFFKQQQSPITSTGIDPVKSKISEKKVRINLSNLAGVKDTYSTVSINAKNTQVAEIIDIVGDIAEVNFFLTDTARDKTIVSLRLVDVSWQEALDVVLRSNGLVADAGGEMIPPSDWSPYIGVAGKVVIISSYEEFTSTQEKRKKAAGVSIGLAKNLREIAEEKSATTIASDSTEITTRSYRLKYADPVEALAYLKGIFQTGYESTSSPAGLGNVKRSSTVFRKDGISEIRLSIYKAENMLTVTAPIRKMQEIQDRIKDIDKPPRQVYITARIVEVQRNYVKDLGVRWGGFTTATTGYTFPHTIGITGASQQPSESYGDVVSLPPNSGADPLTGNPLSNPAGAALGVTIGSVSGAALINAKLFALEQAGVSHTVSNPKIMAINGTRAVIKSGKEIPYQSTSANTGTSIRFKEAVISLEVVPFIVEGGKIRMKIIAKKDEVDTSMSVQGSPAIKKKEISTSVVVENGGSIVLGGVFEGADGDYQDRVPWFHKVPVLGWLFKNKRSMDNQLELLVFITPTIVDMEQ